MTSDIILDLDHHEVRLLSRTGRDEAEIGRVRLDDPEFADRLGDLRDAVDAARAPAVDVLLPPSLVLFVDAGDTDDAALARRIEVETSCSTEELVIGRAGGAAAAVERATVEEARDFLVAHGFAPRSYLARRDGGADEVTFPLAAPAPLADDFATGAAATESRGAVAPGRVEEDAEFPPKDGEAGAKEARQERGVAEGPPQRPPRRDEQTWQAPSAPLVAPAVDAATSEADRLTVFGARDRQPRSRSLAPTLAAATVAGAVLVAGYLLFGGGDRDEVEIVAIGDPVVETVDPDGVGVPADPVEQSAAEPGTDASDAATAEPDADAPSDEAPQIDRATAAWEPPRSELASSVQLPEPAALPEVEVPSDLHSPSEREVGALGLPVTPPPPPGSVFDMDQRGLVRPSEDGALTPKGVTVYSGPPSVLPPDRSDTAEGGAAPQVVGPQDDAALEPPQGADPDLPELARAGPEQRPEGASPAAAPTVLSAGEDTPRPRARPASVEQVAVASRGPVSGDADGEALAERARSPSGPATAGLSATRAAEPPPPEPVGTPNVAVQPSLPTRAAVADQATLANAISLERVNLVGVYGSASDRRALIRLPTGRYLKVKVGDRVDGGQVAAIQANRVEYVKAGRRYSLTLPNG